MLESVGSVSSQNEYNDSLIHGPQPLNFFDQARARIRSTLGPFKIFAGPVNRFLGVDQVEQFYNAVQTRREPTFEQRMLAELESKFEWHPQQLLNFPRTGAVIVTPDHPSGPRESVIMEALRFTGRTDIKIMTTVMLKGINEIKDYCIFVDNMEIARPKNCAKNGEPKSAEELEYESKRAARRAFNLAAKKEAEEWLKAGHVLVIFPAGAVSYFQPKKMRVMDPPWNIYLAQLFHASRATAVAAHFEGHNSLAFQIFGQIPDVRTMLLFRELLNKRGKKFGLQFGQPIPYERLAEFQDDRKLVEFLRAQTYALSLHKKIRKSEGKISKSKTEIVTPTDSIDIRPQFRELLAQILDAENKLESLPANVLVRSKERVVFVFKGDEMPSLLHKLGDRRAINFLRVGEGNGRRDNDFFDYLHYHLVSWNIANEEIEGAYRLGVIPELLQEHGLGGIYLYQFVDFSRDMVESGPLQYAAELGRAYVEKKYEGDATLYNLWKGIAEFLYRKKNIMVLTGVVSVSNDYTPTSQMLAIEIMKKNFFADELQNEFQSRTPPKLPRKSKIVKDFLERGAYNLEDVERIVTQLENKKLPPFLKFYSSIGAKVLNANLDREFNSVDIPVILTLYQNEYPLVKRSFGLSKYKEMQTHWGELLKRTFE
jgi:putative hemolysin